MSEQQAETQVTTQQPQVAATAANNVQGNRPRQQNDRRQQGGNKQHRPRRHDVDDEFDTRIIKVRRVSRMFKGGRRMRLSVFIVAGDRNGRVGLGLGKGADVSAAQDKARVKAKKNVIMVPLKGNTIPHEIEVKYKASRLILKPAAPGTGIIAGATVKGVLELAGVKDVLTKVLGSTNQINAAYAAIEALKSLRGSRL